MVSADFFDNIRVLSRVLRSPPYLVEALFSVCDLGQVFVDWRRRYEDDPRILSLYCRMLNYLYQIFLILAWRYMLGTSILILQASIIRTKEDGLLGLS